MPPEDTQFKPDDPRLIGNKFGKNGGRPRTVSLSPEEMIALGEEMVKWVKENKPIHLSMWYTQEKDFTDKEWDTFRKCPEFFHYYTKALKLVGYSYLDKDSSVDVRLKDRWQRVYFKDLKEEEDETAAFNAQLTKQPETQVTEEQNQKLDQLLAVMRSNQKDLKSEDSNSSNE